MGGVGGSGPCSVRGSGRALPALACLGVNQSRTTSHSSVLVL